MITFAQRFVGWSTRWADFVKFINPNTETMSSCFRNITDISIIPSSFNSSSRMKKKETPFLSLLILCLSLLIQSQVTGQCGMSYTNPVIVPVYVGATTGTFNVNPATLSLYITPVGPTCGSMLIFDHAPVNGDTYVFPFSAGDVDCDDIGNPVSLWVTFDNSSGPGIPNTYDAGHDATPVQITVNVFDITTPLFTGIPPLNLPPLNNFQPADGMGIVQVTTGQSYLMDRSAGTNSAIMLGCNSALAFPAGPIAIDPNGSVVGISGCNFSGDYATLTGAVPGQVLEFTSSNPTDFISISTTPVFGAALFASVTPCKFVNTFSGTLYMHVSGANLCGAADVVCRTTTVQVTNGGSTNLSADDCTSDVAWLHPNLFDNCDLDTQFDTLKISFSAGVPAPSALPTNMVFVGSSFDPLTNLNNDVVSAKFYTGSGLNCVGQTIVTYLLKDASGNDTTLTFTVEVSDNQSPLWGNNEYIIDDLKNTLSSEIDVFSSHVNNFGKDIRVYLDCNDPDFAADLALLSTYEVPSAELCRSKTVSKTGPTTASHICSTFDLITEVYQSNLFKYGVVDQCGNDLDGTIVGEQANLTIRYVDHMPPDITVSGVTLPAPDSFSTIINPDLYRHFSFGLYKYLSAYNPTGCSINFTGLPDLAIIGAVDCRAISHSWVILSSVDQFGNPTGLAGTPSVGNDNNPDITYPVGTHIIQYTLVDPCGNTTEYRLKLIIVDDVAPTISGCPSNATLNTATGICEQAYSWIPPTATDNCVLNSITSSVTALDEGGNPIPIITGFAPGCINVSNFTGYYAGGAWTQNLNGGTGIIGLGGMPTTLTIQASAGPQNTEFTRVAAYSGIVSFTWSYTGVGALDNFVLLRNGVPTTLHTGLINGTGSISFAVTGGQTFGFRLTSNGFNPRGIITINNFTFTCGQGAYATFPEGMNTVQYIFTDQLLNKDTCTFKVNVQDTQNPTALCNNITKSLNAAGTITVAPSEINGGSSDNCAVSSLSLNLTNFNCSNLGANAVVLTVTDASANTSTCAATVTITDDAAPINVSCPPNITVPNAAGFCNANVPFINALFSDGCLGTMLTGDTVRSDAMAIGSPYPVGSTTITYTYTEPVAPFRTASCNRTITVTDSEKPIFTSIPSGIVMINTPPGLCSAVAMWPNVTANDNCVVPTISSTHASGSTFPVGFTTVTYTASDNAGNIRTASFIIQVKDGNNPLAQCKNVVLYLNNSGNATVSGTQVDGGSQDDCGIASRTISKDNITFTNTLNYNCSEIGNNTVIFKATDAGGNFSTCTAQVSVLDTTAPVAVCQNITRNLSSSNPGNITVSANDFNNGSTDNCSIVLYEFSDNGGTSYQTSKTYNCGDIGIKNIIFRVTDQSGNKKSCNATLTILDVTNPSLTCPSSISIANDVNVCNATRNITVPTPTDNCTVTSIELNIVKPTGPPVNLTGLTAGSVISQVFPVGINTLTYTVKDQSNNMATCFYTITVSDTTKPVVVCKGPLNRTTGADSNPFDCFYTVQGTEIDATATDNCGIMKITWVCSGATTAASPPAGSTVGGLNLNVGVNNFIFTATDIHGNISTCTTTITVTDDWVPVFNFCPSDQTVNVTAGTCNALVSWYTPYDFDVFDNCGVFTMQEMISDPSVVPVYFYIGTPPNYNPPVLSGPPFFLPQSALFPVGVTTVTYKATDIHGNTGVCSFNVEVIDNETPDITCPANQSLNTICASGTVPNYTALALKSDNCLNNTVVSQIPAPGTLLSSLGIPLIEGSTFPVKLILTDGFPLNGADTCMFTVTLHDGVAPIPDLGGATLPPASSLCNSLTVTAPTAHDCGVLIYGIPSTGQFITGSNPPQYKFTNGTYNVIWTYIDAQNNTSSQNQVITVVDDLTPPAAICKDITVNLNAAGNVTITPAQIDNGSNDLCGIFSLTLNKTSFNCSNVGGNTVVLTVTDIHNNLAACNANVTVKDITAPIFIGTPVDVTVACNAVPAPPSIGSGGIQATDACGISSTIFSATNTQGGSSNVCSFYSYTITRKWTATDNNNNVTTVSQVITVQDNSAPTFTAAMPDSVKLNNTPNLCSAPLVFSLTGTHVTDNCAPFTALTITSSSAVIPSGGANVNGTYPKGVTAISFTVKDPCGNTSTKILYVKVSDIQAPVPVCVLNIAVPLDAISGTVSIPAHVIDNGSFDNCDLNSDLTLSIAPSSFTCADAGKIIPVKLTVTDKSGNTAFCTTNVEVQDNTNPVITSCPADITIQCNASINPDSNLTLGKPVATDNCSFTSSYLDVFKPGVGSNCIKIERLWTVTDKGGNKATCLQNIHGIDNTAPVFTSPIAKDTTLTCGALVPAVASQTASDICDANVTVTFSETGTKTSNNTCTDYAYTITRKWEAKDDCNNTQTRIQVITIKDTVGPVFTGGPTSLTFFTNDFNANNCSVPVSLNLTNNVQDCQPASAITITNNSPVGPHTGDASANYNTGNYTITFTATDKCNNSTTKTVSISVKDNSVPTAICKPGFNVNLNSDGLGVITPAKNVDDGSYDNCATNAQLTYKLSKDSFNCGELGFHTITLTVTDLSGNINTCTSVIEVIASNASLNLNHSFSVTNESAPGAGNGAVTVSVTGGSGNYTYKWNNTSGSTTPTITNLNAGTYTVTITDTGTGCKKVVSAAVLIGGSATDTISGMLMREDNVPITNATVYYSGTVSGSVPVNAQGKYSFVVPAGSNITIAPFKNINPKNGVTSLDQSIIQQYVLSSPAVKAVLLPSPYKILAADCDSSNLINSGEYTVLQAVITASNANPVNFVNVFSWRFVPQFFVFNTPTLPFIPAPPHKITLNNVIANMPNQNFIGMKVGDVSCPISCNNPNNATGNLDTRSGMISNLNVKDQSGKSGDVISIHVQPEDMNKLIALQAELGFDVEYLKFNKITSPSNIGIHNGNVNAKLANEGSIFMAWASAAPVPLDPGASFITLEFEVVKSFNSLENIFFIKQSDFFNAAYDVNYNEYDLGVTLNQSTSTGNLLKHFQLFQNKPNPFFTETIINFELPAAAECKLKVYDVTGMMVSESSINGKSGLNEYTLKNIHFNSGIYYFELTTQWGILKRKMMRLE